jgi:Ca2+-binding RTX toxin-like protein
MTITASFSNADHTLVIKGDEQDNFVEISTDASGRIVLNDGTIPITGDIPAPGHVTSIEAAGFGGNDRFTFKETDFFLPANFLGDDGNDQLLGNAADNILEGGAGDDELLGFGGDDILEGGFGNDFIAAGGTGQNQLFGNAGDDQLFGADGNDTLSGGPGNDFMEGGKGDDTYTVDSANDVIQEFPNEGNDTVQSSAFTFRLPTNVENLVMLRNARNGLGNDQNNQITVDFNNTTDNALRGFGGDDLLKGGVGNDLLDGGDGTDFLISGAGNDSLVGGNGNDHLDGGVGNDTLLGGEGNDLLEGGPGNDVIDGGNGFDKLAEIFPVFSVSPTASNFTLTNTSLKTASGESNTLSSIEAVELNFQFVAGSNPVRLDASAFTAGNVTLQGGNGDDQLLGGSGDDLLMGDDLRFGGTGNDDINGGAGIDRVISNFSSTNFVLIDHPDGSSTLTGNGTDTLRGIEKVSLAGGSGTTVDASRSSLETTLDGVGANILKGGKGNTTYVVDDIGDQVIESFAQGGIDTVQSRFSFTLGNNLEKLILQDGNLNGTGNSLNNVIVGGSGNNTLNGGSGNDIVVGLGGDDTLIGGNGSDRFTFTTASTTSPSVAFSASLMGVDTINDFSATDKIVLDKNTFTSLNSAIGTGLDFTDFAVVTSDTDAFNSAAIIVYNSTNGHLFYNQNSFGKGLGSGGLFATLATHPNLTASNFVVSTAPTIFNLLTSKSMVSGSAQADVLTGTNASGILNGFAGNDKLLGNGGDDDLYGGKGNDMLKAGVGADYVEGNQGNDLIDLGKDRDVDTVVYHKGDGRDIIRNFHLGAGGDKLQIEGINAVDVVRKGSSTYLHVGDGIAGNTGFGSGQLLMELRGVTSFSAGTIGQNLAVSNQAQFLFT